MTGKKVTLPPVTDFSGSNGDRFSHLMRAAQDGDAAAYGSLLRELLPVVRRVVVARGYFRESHDIEDVVQEILISVHAARATYDPARPFLPWMLAIARNRMADALRRLKRTTVREMGLDDAGVTFEAVASNTEQGHVGDPETLSRAIAELPAGQRQAITLLKLEQLSLSEASERTGMSISALKVATHRAMSALKRKLTGGSES